MLALGTGVLVHQREFADAVAVIEHAIASGITYIDTARDYRSEPAVGKAIAGRRKELFIATKSLERGYDGAMRELEASLKDLGTDRIDLWQVHSIGHRGASGDVELERLRQADGVMKAMRKAREEKVCDFIGFTGHTNPAFMTKILDAGELDFDTMLFIISASLARENQHGWEDDVLPAGRKRGLGLIAMKVFGGGGAVGYGDGKATPAELLAYVWDRGLPVANVGLYTKEQVDLAVSACKAYAARGAQPGGKGSGSQGADAGLRQRFRGLALPFERPGYEDTYAGRA